MSTAKAYYVNQDEVDLLVYALECLLAIETDEEKLKLAKRLKTMFKGRTSCLR